jgi:hypothetical protein
MKFDHEHGELITHNSTSFSPCFLKFIYHIISAYLSIILCHAPSHNHIMFHEQLSFRYLTIASVTTGVPCQITDPNDADLLLYNQAWKRQDYQGLIQSTPDLTPPERLALPPQYFEEYKITHALIRKEYCRALSAIIGFYKGEVDFGDLKPEDDSDDEDSEPDAKHGNPGILNPFQGLGKERQCPRGCLLLGNPGIGKIYHIEYA